MAEGKLNEELEEQDFSSFYRVDVYRQNRNYARLAPEEQKDIPFSGTDYFAVEKAYSVYTFDQKQISERVKEAVERVYNLYCVRVYHIPLNSKIGDEESLEVIVFDSKGEMVVNTGCRSFKAGEIVEYHDLKEDVVRLAVVYEAPVKKNIYIAKNESIIRIRSKEDSELSNDSDDDLYDQKDYKLFTNEGSDWIYIPTSCVARPTFPVSDAFKEKLERVYEKKVEDVKNGMLSFEDLLDLL